MVRLKRFQLVENLLIEAIWQYSTSAKRSRIFRMLLSFFIPLLSSSIGVILGHPAF